MLPINMIHFISIEYLCFFHQPILPDIAIVRRHECLHVERGVYKQKQGSILFTVQEDR